MPVCLSTAEFLIIYVLEVAWIGKVNRDELSTKTENMAGAIATMSHVAPEATEAIVGSDSLGLHSGVGRNSNHFRTCSAPALKSLSPQS